MRAGFLLPALLALGSALSAEQLTFQGQAAWSTWKAPLGLTQIGQRGELKLVKFRKDINAVEDAHRFAYESRERGLVKGGLWEANSNPATADNVIDGDPETFWQPQADDALEDWAVEIDLGRAVLAREIRLTFPDQEGARPFRQFTLYASTGTRISVKEDLVLFEPVFRTSRPNQESVVSIPLDFLSGDSTLVVDQGLAVDRQRESHYRVVQRLRVEAEEKTPQAALAEIEVLAVGDNLSIGTLARGHFVNGINAVDPQNLFDADMNTNNLIGSSYGNLGWKDGGVWFGVDLGAAFFVDELFLYSFKPDEGLVGFSLNGTGPGYTVLFSDGQQSLGSNLPVPEAFDYTELFTHLEPNADRLLYVRYLFAPRKMRYFFWHGVRDTGWGIVKWAEFMLFSPGYPAEVVLKSDFIDLGQVAGDGRPKAIKALHWDADLPERTRLQLRSRSGNSLSQVYAFYDKKGEEVTEEKWNSLPKVVRGKVDTTLVVGEDWGGWSNVYQASGEPFQSESPRRYVLLEMILSTEDPQVAPLVNSLSIEFEDALLQGAFGRIEPRQVQPNQDTRFTYRLWPQVDELDSGFDLLRLIVPGPVNLEGVQVLIGPRAVSPASVSQRQDSLLVALPQKVMGDSLRLGFTTRLLHNAAVFALDLGLSDRPGLWQSVEPAERRANVVLLPGLADSRRLIGGLTLSSPVLTPNGDGINEALEIRFVVFKLEAAAPRLVVYDLAGRQLVELEAVQAGAEQVFTWSGRDRAGQLVRPGLYLYRIELGAESGSDVETGSLAVVY
jgi:hypothetical protein